jgi:DNA polymerase III subunit beta
MKLLLDRPAFLSALQLVARATATRSAIQALSGILISAEASGAELAATDTEIGLRSQVEAKVEQPGRALVPGRLLVDIVRALDASEVTLEYKVDKRELEVSAAQSRFVLKGLASEDFPHLPSPPESDALKMPADVFAKTIDRVARAASRDETRPVLTGILVSVSDGRLRMVATDSYRLSVRETKADLAGAGDFEVNVPARALQEASRIIADAKPDQIVVFAAENQVVFGIGPVVLSSRMIDGQFPNYQQLLPESYEQEIRLDRSELMGVVRRVSLMAQRNAPLRLKFEEGSLTVAAQTPDVGEASEVAPIAYSGEPLEIGFNPQFLQDGLETAEVDELVLKLISPLRPGLIEAGTTGEGGEADGSFLYLIMPVRLNV